MNWIMKKLEEYAVEGYQRDHQGENIQFYQVINIENDTLTYVAYNIR